MTDSRDHSPESRNHGVCMTPVCLSSPFEVHLKITNRCNLHCWHCHSNAGLGSGTELSYDEIKALCIDLADWGVCELAVSGGEPFLREDCIKIVDVALQSGLQVKINTNGILLSERILGELATLGVYRLMVSLDGATAAVHDAVRGSEGAFDSTVRSITEAVKRGFEVMLRMTVNQANQKQIKDFVRLAEVLNVMKVGLTPVLQMGRAVNEYNSKGIPLCDWHRIAAHAKHAVSGSSCRLVDTFAFFEFESEVGPVTGLSAYLAGCKAGKTLVSIDHKGGIWPCSLLHTPATALGNIRYQSLRDVWKKSPVLKEFRQVTPASFAAPCCDCPSVWQCMGGCRAYAMAATGCPVAPDPRCPRTVD